MRETDSVALLTQQPPASFLAQAGFTFSVNPLSGCFYGCRDCYVPDLPVVKFRRGALPNGRSTSAGSTWGAWVEVRTRAPEVLELALRRGQLAAATLFLSPVTDVYWPGERRYRLTRQLLPRFLAHRGAWGYLLISTRSQHILDDLDLLAALGDKLEVAISIPSDRPDVLRILGTRNPSVATRLWAARRLLQAGIPTRISVAPLQPHTPQFVDLLAESGATVWVDWSQHTSCFASVYQEHGWSIPSRAAVEAFAAQLRSRVGDSRVRVGTAQFRSAHWPDSAVGVFQPVLRSFQMISADQRRAQAWSSAVR
ncbi:MAG: radical SAM protein [Dehalococcoidia bacterium]